MGPLTVFEFEKTLAGSLRCIPMAVRFKLDQCGVKLTLQQWARFKRADRAHLVDRPCDTPDGVDAYRDQLLTLIETRTGQTAKRLAIDAHPEWTEVERVPEAVRRQAERLSVPAPALAQWMALTPLQRFTLLKLAREGHDNASFLPALREFALLGE